MCLDKYLPGKHISVSNSSDSVGNIHSIYFKVNIFMPIKKVFKTMKSVTVTSLTTDKTILSSLSAFRCLSFVSVTPVARY